MSVVESNPRYYRLVELARIWGRHPSSFTRDILKGRLDKKTGEWIRLAIFVDGKKLRATVNGDTVLDIVKTKAEPVMGDIGLWVDIGTEAYFADLHVASR